MESLMPATCQYSTRTIAVCDRCRGVYFHHRLVYDVQWQGNKLTNIRMLVCESCRDKPQEQLRTVIIPADPIPINNPRIENYAAEVDSTLPSTHFAYPY